MTEYFVQKLNKEFKDLEEHLNLLAIAIYDHKN